eukprot:286726-Pleurochrysis_carterae.AAC.2
MGLLGGPGGGDAADGGVQGASAACGVEGAQPTWRAARPRLGAAGGVTRASETRDPFQPHRERLVADAARPGRTASVN